MTDSGRLPAPFLAALAGGLALSAMLPAGAACLTALGAIIVLGVPHGALDGEVARPWLRPRFRQGWFGVFALPYLSLSALVLLAWREVPLSTLAAFLAVSAWHFGEEDAGPGWWLEAAARGGLPIAVPVLLHPAATAGVFGTVALLPLAEPPGWLMAASVSWLPVAALAAIVLGREGRTGTLAEMAGLTCAFAVLPPLTAFAFYFVGFHAPRHMAALVADPARAPRVTTMHAAVLRSMPVTAVTLVLGAALWRFFPGAVPDRLLALTLQGLAALTLPHLLLDQFAGAWAGASPGGRRLLPALLNGAVAAPTALQRGRPHRGMAVRQEGLPW